MRRKSIMLLLVCVVCIATIAVSCDKEDKKAAVEQEKNVRAKGEDNALFPVKKDGKYGYINRDGRIVIKP